MSRMNRSSDDDVLGLVASRQATTRAALARQTGLAPSTITGIVNRLLLNGLLEEGGDTASTGGRPGSILLPANSRERALVVELGAHRARFGLADRGGRVSHVNRFDIDIAEGPTTILRTLVERGEELAERSGTEISGYGIALPGPVDPQTGTVVGPSRMPGWNGCTVPEAMREWSELPVVVENDARIGASGESAYRRATSGAPSALGDYIYVKAGSGIGGAFVENGAPRRGAHGLAGDVTHVPVPAGGDRPCQCGNTGCLDTIASAESIRRELRAQGLTLPSNDALIETALDGSAQVVTMIRSAGVNLGIALSHTVSFLAPDAVIIGGTLSAVDAFVGGVRQSLHERCLQSVMEHTAVEKSLAGTDSALWGLAEATSVFLNARGAHA